MGRKVDLPPRDCAIKCEPGQGVQINARLQSRWIDSAREYRRLRGEVLVAAFQLEYALDSIIRDLFFPGLGKVPKEDPERATFASNIVLENAFTGQFLRGANSTLGRKLEIFKALAKDVQVLGKLVSESLKADLKQAVENRNRFAHAPVVFRMIGMAPEQELEALLLYKGQEFSITPATCLDARQQILSTSEELTKISQALKANLSRVDAGEAVDLAGTIWMFHVGLDSSEWKVRDIGNAIDFRDFLVMASREVKIDINVEADEKAANSNLMDRTVESDKEQITTSKPSEEIS